MLVIRAMQVLALFAASLFGLGLPTPASAAPPTPTPTVETNLFVLPNKPLGNGILELQPSDFRATVGKQAYEVRSVTRAADRGNLKTVVVFDLASTAPESRPCLLAQARSIAPRLLALWGASLFVVASESPETRQRFSSVAGATFEYFLPGSRTAETDPCSPLPGEGPKIRGKSTSRGVFQALAQTLSAEAGPVRVLWIGQQFDWFSTRSLGTEIRWDFGEGQSYATDPFTPPTAAYEWIDELTRAGVSVFPIIWKGTTGGDARVMARQRAGDAIARYLGGRASVCSVELGPCVENALETLSRGWIVQIAGPAVERTSSYSLKTLKLWYQQDRAHLEVSRPFLLAARPQIRIPIALNKTASPLITPLLDAVRLTGRVGCEGVAGSGERKRALTALVPFRALRERAGELLSVAEFHAVPPAQSGADRQMVLEVLRDKSPTAAGEITTGTVAFCVDLPALSSAKGSYRIIVFNPKTSWAGVGILPVADVVAYMGQK